MNLDTPVNKLFMVGPTYAKRLEKLGIKTAEDLLYHFPFRHEDYTQITPIAHLRPNEIVTIQGQLCSMKNEYTKTGKKIQKAKIRDQSGEIEVIWFNQPYLVRALKINNFVNFSGKTGWFNRKITLVSPEFEVIRSINGKNPGVERKTLHTGRLVPIYHETHGLSSKWLRSRIAPLIDKLTETADDPIPLAIRKKHQLLDWGKAIKQVHFPGNIKEFQGAQKRLAFEEMFLIHLKTLQRKKTWQKQKPAFPLQIDGKKTLSFLESLPFELTKAQKRTIKEILADLKKNKPMNRLLEGDVGSGKTVVAASAIFTASACQVQSALMAPTEILAHQHYQTLKQILTPLGVKIALMTSSLKKSVADFDLAIGTHALIYRKAKFKKLGLVVIDEQHRFGVEQRSQLIKKGQAPHILTMTATPIPRTITLTLYGDLDLSVIDEMPPGRLPIKTWVVPTKKRQPAYQWIKKQIKNKPNQAFIICPLIEESAHETLKSVRAVTTEFAHLKNKVFQDLKLGLLHGRLKAKEKKQVIEQFKKGQLDILVSTPVVEVGIDVPSATIMMIEAAERFGLAQLHQLRGRVGRGEAQSYCLLFPELQGKKIFHRLKALEKTNLGMELAEIDLKLRGPGQVYGTAQHGFFDLKMASFNDYPLIEKTKKAAGNILSTDPRLNKHQPLKNKLERDKISSIEPN
ncbi:ATP-dependent DNA helicase RecG [Patescibacteria group bacterium]